MWRCRSGKRPPLAPPAPADGWEGFLRSSLSNGHYCSINEEWDADMRDALLSSSRRSLPAPTSGDPPPRPSVGKLWGVPRADLLSRRDNELVAQRGTQGPAFPFFLAKTSKVWFESHRRSRGGHTGCLSPLLAPARAPQLELPNGIKPELGKAPTWPPALSPAAGTVPLPGGSGGVPAWGRVPGRGLDARPPWALPLHAEHAGAGRKSLLTLDKAKQEN